MKSWLGVQEKGLKYTTNNTFNQTSFRTQRMVPREKASFVFPETQTLRFNWGLRETMKIVSTYETSVELKMKTM